MMLKETETGNGRSKSVSWSAEEERQEDEAEGRGTHVLYYGTTNGTAVRRYSGTSCLLAPTELVSARSEQTVMLELQAV